jgi:hypothetical protein
MSKAVASAASQAAQPITLAIFLGTVPPGSSHLVQIDLNPADRSWCVSLPPVWTHCQNKACTGEHWFDPRNSTTQLWFDESGRYDDVETWKYTCRHCRSNLKTFSVLIRARQPQGLTGRSQVVSMSKIGEIPAYGVPASASLKGFLEDDAELFVKGRKSEAQGLGIGSFTYYRRVVENQKQHLVKAVRSVAELEGLTPQLKTALETAEAADGFTRAYEALRGHLPASLRISGHDPLQLLYDQTSHGLHNLSDSDCLTRAATIREVLAAMATRIQELLRTNETLAKAVGQLSNLGTMGAASTASPAATKCPSP